MCWICRQGHIKRNCPNWEKDEVNVVNPKEESDGLCLSTILSQEVTLGSWTLALHFIALLVENGFMIITKMILDM